MSQGTLFDMAEARPSLDDLVASASASIGNLFRKGIPLILATSFGKDSTCMASLALTTAKQLLDAGEIQSALIVVTTSDTLVENPEVAGHYRAELDKIATFAQTNGIEFYSIVCQPSILNTFQIKVLTGRGLPSYPEGNSDCSVDLKISPQVRERKKLFDSLKHRGLPEPVTLLGTRFAESEARAFKMKARGESAIEPVRNKDGDLVLSPICNFQTEDVWEYLVLTGSSKESYSDFEETQRIYAHAEGQGCAVIADAISDSMKKSRKGGCGARHGCWACQKAVDKSLENMVEYDERYRYARGLNKLNKFLRAIKNDYSRRHWIGRTIKAGFIKIQPDTFHPKTVRELFRYMVQLDYDEQVRAAAAGESPKFQILSLEMILVVDALWSRNGLAKPFSAWFDLYQIHSGAVRYDIPDIEPVQNVVLPDARFLYVGSEWDDTLPPHHLAGLRDNYIEGLTFDAGCGPKLRTLESGKTVWDISSSDEFEVNSESLEMILQFELDEMVGKYNDPIPPSGITYGYKWYLQYGAISVSAGQVAMQDIYLRRTALKDSLGLTVEYEIEDLLSKSMRFADLPDDARKVWGKYATTESAQMDMLDEEWLEEIEADNVTPIHAKAISAAARREEAEARREVKRREIARNLISLHALYCDWAPDVNWRQLVRNQELKMSRLPAGEDRIRKHLMEKYPKKMWKKITFKSRKAWARWHLINKYKLLDFLVNHPEVLERVKTHRQRRKPEIALPLAA